MDSVTVSAGELVRRVKMLTALADGRDPKVAAVDAAGWSWKGIGWDSGSVLIESASDLAATHEVPLEPVGRIAAAFGVDVPVTLSWPDSKTVTVDVDGYGVGIEFKTLGDKRDVHPWWLDVPGVVVDRDALTGVLARGKSFVSAGKGVTDGVAFRQEGGGIAAFATERHILMREQVDFTIPVCVLPPKAALAALAVLPAGGVTVHVGVEESVALRAGGVTVCVRMPGGDYPKVSRVIGDVPDDRLSVDAVALRRALGRKGSALMLVESGRLVVNGVDVPASGNVLDVSVNVLAEMLAKVLAPLRGMVELAFVPAKHHLYVVDPGRPGFLAVGRTLAPVSSAA